MSASASSTRIRNIRCGGAPNARIKSCQFFGFCSYYRHRALKALGADLDRRQSDHRADYEHDNLS
jgi:hypothetical protein